MKKRFAIALLCFVTCSGACFGHVGSPDVYFQGNAGPYHVVVTVRTPQMIPGVAEIELRSDAPNVTAVKVTPLYITGDGSQFPPPPDALQRSQDDPQFFSGKIWMMDGGSWEVRIEAEGALGPGTLAVPVPAFARSSLGMSKGLGALLLGVMILLVAAVVAIFGAARREGTLEPGERPDAEHRQAARKTMAATLAITLGLLAAGGWWWEDVASANTSRKIYRPPNLDVSLAGDQMTLHIAESGWRARRQDPATSALIPDHGHLMHLFLVREPQMDRLYHLHPQQAPADASSFLENLPAIDAGRYRVFADIVRASGFPDTMVKEIEMPEIPGRALTGDDSEAAAAPLAAADAGALASPLSGGARMIWERDPGPLASNRLILFRFRVEDAAGKPVADLEPYMGMAAHAEFIASDFSVFAHVHPDGSVAMAALELTASHSGGGVSDASGAMPGMDMSGMPMPGMNLTGMGNGQLAGPLPAEVTFPYGFPKPGLYRIFMQVKRKGKVETGVFDAEVN